MLTYFDPRLHLPLDAPLEEKSRLIFRVIDDAHNALTSNGRSVVAVVGYAPDVFLLFSEDEHQIVQALAQAQCDLPVEMYEVLTKH